MAFTIYTRRALRNFQENDESQNREVIDNGVISKIDSMDVLNAG